MFKLLAVFLGGSIGACLRFLISDAAKDFGSFYASTLFINITGSMFLGFVSYIAIKMNTKFDPNLKLFLTTGIAGGFTTFSTFNYEIFQLFQSNQVLTGFAYMFLSLFLGLFATVLGAIFAQKVFSTVFSRFTFQAETMADNVYNFDDESKGEEELTETDLKLAVKD